MQEYSVNGEQDRVNASALSENSVVSVSVGDSSNASRPTTNGEGGGLFQKHSKFSGSSTTAYGTGGVNAQIQHRNTNNTGNGSKYGTISTSDVERREVSKKTDYLFLMKKKISMMTHPARFDKI